MPEIRTIECEVEEIVEPLALEHKAGFVVLLAVLPGEDERFLQGLSLALGDTAGEVQIDQRVVVHVEQGAAVRLLVIDRRLPCLPPRGDVLLVRLSVCWFSSIRTSLFFFACVANCAARLSTSRLCRAEVPGIIERKLSKNAFSIKSQFKRRLTAV